LAGGASERRNLEKHQAAEFSIGWEWERAYWT
jgi:hypothetical protein